MSELKRYVRALEILAEGVSEMSKTGLRRSEIVQIALNEADKWIEDEKTNPIRAESIAEKWWRDQGNEVPEYQSSDWYIMCNKWADAEYAKQEDIKEI